MHEASARAIRSERGVPGPIWADVCDCMAKIDDLLAQPELSEQCLAGYVEQNARFHSALAAMAASDVVEQQIHRACALPFASPNAFVLERCSGPRARDVLVVAQNQHRTLLDAIRRREGARAEGIAREHARMTQRNLDEMLHSRKALNQVPGSALIRRPGVR